MTIDALISRLEKVNIKPAVQDGVGATNQELIRLQRLQLLTGERSDGKKIGKYRSNAYAIRKAAMNPLAGFGNMDLRLTGSTYQNIFVDERENSVVIDSLDPKVVFLTANLGSEIFGLNPENSKEYSNNYLGPAVTRIIKGKLG